MKECYGKQFLKFSKKSFIFKQNLKVQFAQEIIRVISMILEFHGQTDGLG